MDKDSLIPWCAAGVIVLGLVMWWFCPASAVETAPIVRPSSGVCNKPTKPVEPVTPVPARRPSERYYRDSHGAIVSETEAEDGLRQIRNKMNSMPDNLERAGLEGVLQALETEWARIKRQGPIDAGR